MILNGLPPIVCVKSIVVGEPTAERVNKRVAAKPTESRKPKNSKKAKRRRG